MANIVTATIQLQVNGTFEKETDLTSAIESFATGSNDFDAIKEEYTDGTGSNQIKSLWFDERTLTTTATDSLDLAGGLTDVYGATITFTVLKFILIDIDAPDGTKVLRVGPRSVANAFVGPFGDSSDFVNVYRTFYISEPYTGWTVTAGTGDLLVINNNTAGSITYRIMVGGEV